MFRFFLQRMSQDGLNLNVVRNGDAVSTRSNPSRGEHNGGDVAFSSIVKKNLEAPQSNSPSHTRKPIKPSHSRQGSNGQSLISEDGNGGRRKYFPKLLQ